MLGRIEGRKRRGAREDVIVGWHHRLNGREFEQTLQETVESDVLQFMGLQRVGHD